MTFKTIVAEERHAIPSDWRRVLAKFPNDLWDAWEERAAIIQYDGQEPRPTAERRAFECITRAYEEAAALLRDHLDSATDGQSVDGQVKEPRAAGAEKVFRETASGARSDRGQLRRALDQLDKGDVLMVTRLDRLARSTRDLLNTSLARSRNSFSGVERGDFSEGNR